MIIPVVDPWGYVNDKRWNSNHVDLNRNFPTYWDNGDSDPSSANYRGASAGSEAETQYVMDILEEFAGKAVFFYDLHTFGSRDTYANNTDFEFYAYRINELQQIGIATLWEITASGWSNHDLPTTSGFLGHLQSYAGERVGMAGNYGAYLSIPSASPECMYRYNDGLSTDTDYSPKINFMNTEYVTYSVLNALRKLI